MAGTTYSMKGTKNYFLLLFTLVLTLYNGMAYGQAVEKVKVVYKMELLNQPPDDIKPQTLAILAKIKEALDQAEYILYIENQKSLFQKENRMSKEGEDLYNNLAEIADGLNDQTFTNRIEKKQIIQKSGLGKFYIITQKVIDFNWKLFGEEKLINGFNCRKAEGSFINEDGELTDVEAWYTQDIPLQFGPDIFHGLPGLILEVKFKEKKIQLKKLSLNPKEKFIIKKPEEGEAATQQEIRDQSERALRDFGF